MQVKRYSERKVIIFTAALILLSGIIGLASYTVGIILFYLAFIPYLSYRIYFIYKKKGQPRDNTENYRFIVLAIMMVTILFNLLGWQEADFFLLFLLMIDFLLVSNKKE